MSDDLLEDLGAVLALLDPVPAGVLQAAATVLHQREDADPLRYAFDRVVGMGYFPDELGLPVAPPGHVAAGPAEA